MIAYDHRHKPFALASALALGIAFLGPISARASDDAAQTTPPVVIQSNLVTAPAAAPTANVDVSLSCDGRYAIVSTKTETVSQFLAARGIHVTEDDFVSEPLDAELVDGMNLTFRSSKILTILDGAKKRTIRSSAPTIAVALREAGLSVSKHDLVVPLLTEAPLPSDVIRIERFATWTVHSRTKIAQRTRNLNTDKLASGVTRTLDPGAPGLRETTMRVVRDQRGRLLRTVVASRVIRMPRARIVAHGVGSSLAMVAARGITNAMHFAGAALHMIATAYTATCYGCSGITATGQHAGLGIIAVDPTVIPLGTRLFIPGYGRAIAGDTGGAIRGHRVDLGMNTVAAALRFGRRPITVYVLR